MRWGISVMVLGVCSPAFAEPRVEGSGFIGLDFFGDRMKLGSDWEAERNTGAAPVFGTRLSLLSLPIDDSKDTEIAFGAEAELSWTSTYTIPMSATSVGGSHNSYMTPIIGWRAHGIFRVGDRRLAAHFVLGAGGETVTSWAPFIKTQTESQLYWGGGLSIAVGDTNRLRLDGRSGWTPAAAGGRTSMIEIQLGMSTTFGTAHKRPKTIVEPVPPPVTTVDRNPIRRADLDSDHDGFPDSKDKCPLEAETVNGVDDDDGCPELDPDHDGIVGAADKCPDEPEDFDHFEDEDGCPDPDNDHDGIADATDKCPNQAETMNGFDDLDGCPDDVPAPVKAALKALASVKFELNRSRVLPTNDTAMQRSIEVLTAMPDLKLVLVGHPDKEGEKPLDIARRRTESLKWYLLERGILDSDRLTTRTGSVAAGGPVIEIELLVTTPHTATPVSPSKVATPVPPKS